MSSDGVSSANGSATDGQNFTMTEMQKKLSSIEAKMEAAHKEAAEHLERSHSHTDFASIHISTGMDIFPFAMSDRHEKKVKSLWQGFEKSINDKDGEIAYQKSSALPFIEKLVALLQPDLLVEDGRGAPELSVCTSLPPSKRPDIVLKTKLKVGGVRTKYVVGFVELKKHNELGFTRDHQGQLGSYLKALLQTKQPWMEEAWAVLMNKRGVQFMKAQKTDKGVEITVSDLFGLRSVDLDKEDVIPQGIRNLSAFFERAPLQNTVIPGVLTMASTPLDGFLGKGATSYVFESKSKKGQVVKIVPSSQVCAHEFRMLSRLGKVVGPSLIPHVPTVHGSSRNCLIIAPRAYHVLRDPALYPDLAFKGKYVFQLLAVLEKIHQAGIVHRDVRPDNILHHDGGVLLNDWGSAVDFEKPSPYSGARRHASDSVLQHLNEGAKGDFFYKPEDDLIGFIRSVCSLLYPDMHLPRSLTDPADVIVHWKKMPTSWRRLEDLAKEKDPHDKIRSALLTMIPFPHT